MEIDYTKEIEVRRNDYLNSLNVLTSIIQGLNDYEGIQSLSSRKVGMYKLIRKLLPCLDVLHKVSYSGSLASFLTLTRMIIDNYAAFYLLTSHSTEQERNLRYYLYLIDGVTTRSNNLKDFHSNVSKNIYEETHQNIQAILGSDSKSVSQLRKYITIHNFDGYISETIIEQNNWKFVHPKSDKNKNGNQHSSIDLYKIAKIPTHYSNAFQKYYSSYVHGLGLTLFTYSDGDELPMICSSLSIIEIIQSLIAKILLEEYKEKLNNINLNQDFITYMNHHWDNWNKLNYGQ